MAKVIGIGGVFFKCKDPKALGQWYGEHLGMPIQDFGGGVLMPADQPEGGYTVWGPFAEDTEYFNPSKREFMLNLVVDDLDAALAQVSAAGATLVGDPEEHEMGKFGWFVDPEGNKVELWQPKPMKQ